MYYSFSGADFSCAANFSLYSKERKLVNSPSVLLESLTTLSVSISERKSPVRSLGKKNVSGYTSSLRAIGGTMIFNIINKHPLYSLIDEYRKIFKDVGDWAYARDNSISSFSSSELDKLILPTTLPPFNLVIFGVTELGSTDLGNVDTSFRYSVDHGTTQNPYVVMSIEGIELLDDNTTISMNNILTENTFSFVATNVKVIKEVISPFNISDQLNKDIESYFKDQNDAEILNDFNQLQDGAILTEINTICRSKNPYLDIP